ncbi:MAG: AAA family ATPase [Spirochaetia bacterium]|jgi:predicted AAA+ superfamily ATPase|nr:AAA family ATPase [Spirochaetia bacterium]
MKSRKVSAYIHEQAARSMGRILVFTGARQTGKTTLARAGFPEYEYLSIEDPIMRDQYKKLSSAQWKTLYPHAILDEVQKEPQLVESIKAVYDQWQEPRYILLGSSQLLLLEKVKESLAGRCTILDLLPLTVPELETERWEDTVEDSLFQTLLKQPEELPKMLPSSLLDPRHAIKQRAWDHYIRFGGYPALSSSDFSDEDRFAWLKQYVRTYLERDLRDLASFRDLDPFIRLQHFVALNTACTANISSMANQARVSDKTAQRYLRYLELSYQVLIIPAWFRSERKKLVKSPKVHFLDNGVLQAVLQKRGGMTGQEFESLVVSELYKQARTLVMDMKFSFLRTQDGREVDLLIELPQGYFAFEIKMASRISTGDARHLRGLADFLDKPLLHSFILSNDPETRTISAEITAVNAAYFLG